MPFRQVQPLHVLDVVLISHFTFTRGFSKEVLRHRVLDLEFHISSRAYAQKHLIGGHGRTPAQDVGRWRLAPLAGAPVAGASREGAPGNGDVVGAILVA